MRTKHFPVIGCCAVLWIAAAVPVGAELPPSVYEARQKAASEHLKIQVLRVVVEPGEEAGRQRILVTASVESVMKSESGLEAGAIIQIAYQRTDRPRDYTGPGEVPLLEENAATVAYLSPGEGGEYTPAAGIMSFSNF